MICTAADCFWRTYIVDAFQLGFPHILCVCQGPLVPTVDGTHGGSRRMYRIIRGSPPPNGFPPPHHLFGLESFPRGFPPGVVEKKKNPPGIVDFPSG